MAVVTAFGSFAVPERVRDVRPLAAFGAAVLALLLGALAGDALVFAMQLVYRSVQMVYENVPGDCRRHQIVNPFTRREARTNQRGRHVARACLDDEYRRLRCVRRVRVT